MVFTIYTSATTNARCIRVVRARAIEIIAFAKSVIGDVK